MIPIVFTAVLVGAALSSGEVVKQGPITVSFHGDISPRTLPRRGAAPVSVQIGGKIRSSDKENQPVLHRIVLDINRQGRLQNEGLARCPLAELKSGSSADAKRACKAAIVGHGNVTSRVSLPSQGAFATNGPLLAFNGRYKGHPAILAQVATGSPLPLTYVIPFQIRKLSKGAFGTRLIGTLPPIASSYGYISAFDMSLGRSYRFHGGELSFASAGCPAPAGFPGASFPLTKATYEFKDGHELSDTLTRQCKVRGN